jgi:hypothetical protein
MGVDNRWPDFMPTISLELTVSSGTLSIGANSALENEGDYSWGPDQVRGTLWKNGSLASALSINDSTGAITMASGIAVSSSDEIEARFEFVAKVSLPWVTRVFGLRSCFMTVAGDGTTTFDDTYNTMPVPEWQLAFGWDAFDKLKVGVKVNDADSSSRDIALSTRLWGPGSSAETSTTIDLSDTTNAQTHTADFKDADVKVAAQMQFTLANAASNPKVRDTINILIFEPTEVSTYPASFPTTGTMITVTKPGGYWSAGLDD